MDSLHLNVTNFKLAVESFLALSPLPLDVATRWKTWGEDVKVVLHIPSEFVGDMERGWNSLRLSAASLGLELEMEVETTLQEEARWGMASGVPVTASSSITKGGLVVRPRESARHMRREVAA